MSLFSGTDVDCPINLSLPQNAVEQLHYDSKYSGRRQAKQGASAPISVSVQSDEMDEDEIEQVENYLAGLLYSEIGSRYFD